MKRGPELRFVAMLVLVIGGSLLAGGVPRAPELALLDTRFAINRAAGVAGPHVPVVVAAITPESERRLGEEFGPGWRRWYPQMIATLAEAGAAAIAWDATFAASAPEFDVPLAAALGLMPNLAVENTADRNNPVLRPHFAALGWKQVVTPLNVPRRTVAGTPLPAFGSAVAAVATELGLATRSLPDSGESLWIDYSYDLEDVPQVDIADIILGDAMRLADSASTPASITTDRIVFIGLDMPGEDRYPTPGMPGSTAPGVYAHIASAWTYLSEHRIARPGGWVRRVIALLPALAIVLATRIRRRAWRRTTVALAGAVAILLPPIIFAVSRIWLPWFGLLVLAALASAGMAIDRRALLARSYRTSLGFDPALIEQYGKAIEGSAHGIERQAAVLCADVRGYTQFVSDNPASEVQRVMTRYMAQMEDVVHGHGGYINKFVGDEIVAVFGFPLNEERAEERAAQCARDMLEHLVALNGEWSVEGLPILEGIGVGVDAGELRFTNIGGDRRVQFDVIGGPVNGASRLQALTKELECSLIISAPVAEAQRVFAIESTPGGPGTSEAHGTDSDGSSERPELSFLGEVMVRGQGRRRLFGMHRRKSFAY